MKIFLIAIGILAALSVMLILWLPTYIMTGKRQTLEEAFLWQSDHYDTSFYGKLDKTDYTITGAEGYVLHAELLTNPEPTARYMILTHGYTDNRKGALKYVPIYLRAGFNCVIYDLRGHGENKADFTTYGIREGMDLKAVIEDTKKRYPDLSVLGLHGESLGAAATIACLKYRPDVDFAVADCGFSDIRNVLERGFRNAHLPAEAMFQLADLGAKIKYHYSLKEMRPIDSLYENEIPLLFLHGAEDSFIIPQNSRDMEKATKGMADVHLIPRAEHAVSVLVQPELYEKYVSEFLEMTVSIHKNDTIRK
ncbi:MAG: alpha/beta hydrolase [Lachnospiraceae bacterium]|nr:alpha/beta hydrolase [Lachnospiraceae bacterium]